MYTCSICNDTFVGIHQDSTFSTPCGHVFHHQCLKTWFESSKTCPHCRSSVSMNELVKLFLLLDSNAQVSLDRNTDEDRGILRGQLIRWQCKHSENFNYISNLQDKQISTNSALKRNKEDVDKFKVQAIRQTNEKIFLEASIKFVEGKLTTVDFQKGEFELKYQEQCREVVSLSKILQEVQSHNSAMIDKLKSELADLKSEKAYFQRRCHNLEIINIEQPCTSKMCIDNKNSITLQNQTKSEYYGHDPQLKLSAEHFLLGCVFLIVELENEPEGNICDDITMSKLDIIEHGGLVDQMYSARITHIICKTQKHHIVEQGIKDGKRCVTDFWLKDIIARNSMIPPWLAHHFPLPYSINDNLPCQGLNIYIVANFSINEYYRIKSMIELVGGCVIEEVIKADIIVSMKLEGVIAGSSFINRVVNVQWINDIIFGAKLGLKKSGYLQYQQFDLCDPFLVNYDMVSHLMEAWKTPLIFNGSQKRYENQDHFTQNVIKSTVHGTSDLVVKSFYDNDYLVFTFVRPSLNSNANVLFSGFSTDEEKVLKKILYLSGGQVASDDFEPTHLVVNKPITSSEFFFCLPTLKYIVNENWLKDSQSNLKLQDEKQYLIENLQDKNMGLCHVPTLLNQYRSLKLFKLLSFFITPGITDPTVHHLEKIISSAGGIVEKKRRSLESIKETPASSYFIISCLDDYFLYYDLSDIPNVVYSPEFITCSILAQEVLIHKFTIEMFARKLNI